MTALVPAVRAPENWRPTRPPLRLKTDLSVLIPALNEGPNLAILLPSLKLVLDELDLWYEVIVVTCEGDQGTADAASAGGARVLYQTSKGYGGALIDAVRQSTGDYILTLDADLSHRPDFVRKMWEARQVAEVTIASRFVAGGSATMPTYRRYLSRLLNLVFRRCLAIPVRDLSSGFRLYRRSLLAPDTWTGRDFDVLQEILVRAFCEGWQVQEIPFNYMPREHGTSSARLVRLGKAYVRSFWRLWKLRNSVEAADHDYRAFNSGAPLQRHRQRAWVRAVNALIAGEGPVLDVGCGSSRIVGSLPSGSVGVDIEVRELRYDRRFGTALVNASGLELPFADDSFSCVLWSDGMERMPNEPSILDELRRVLKPGGRVVLRARDTARLEWLHLEKFHARLGSGEYSDGHVAHFTRAALLELLGSKGLSYEETLDIGGGGLVMAFRRPRPSVDAANATTSH